ncbi:hypothetical protein TNCV_1795001 [Trichonephila clavipes]|nr:hypothetical protein TNCV_1795001 [Trichonephila clavipes]
MNAGKLLEGKGRVLFPPRHVSLEGKDHNCSGTLQCAEDNFLPSYRIFKGKRKPEFEDDMPPGSHVEMNEFSTYINSDVFMKFLKNHFISKEIPAPPHLGNSHFRWPRTLLFRCGSIRLSCKK